MKRSYSQEELDLVAKDVLSSLKASETTATIVGFCGELGAGKTTLVQAIAKELGVKVMVTSPTFVLAKWYKTKHSIFDTLVHIDAYRVENEQELLTLGFEKFIKEPKSLVVIEWPERLPNILSEINTQTFNLKHEGELRLIEGPVQYEKAK